MAANAQWRELTKMIIEPIGILYVSKPSNY